MPGFSGQISLPYMFPYTCAYVRAYVYVCVRVYVRALARGGWNIKSLKRVTHVNVKRVAQALRVMVSRTPTGIGPLRAINASKEKNPGLLIFKKNILNLDL